MATWPRRARRTTPWTRLAFEQPAESLVGNRYATGRTATGIGDDGVARGGLDRSRVDAGVAELALHRAALVR
ncbi:MAG: hypothetical protein ABJA74_16695, partial [Lapillicoccus sp.]